MKNEVDVFIKVEEGGRLPHYASVHAAGCDLYATEDMAIRPGETKVMPLNFLMAMEEEMEAQIRPRSGLSLKTSLRLPNSPGTIDSDFRDTVGVILQNTYNIADLPYRIAQDPGLLLTLEREYREVELGEYLKAQTAGDFPGIGRFAVLKEKIYIDQNGNPFGTVYIHKGDRIAQMVFCQYKRARFIPHPNPREIGEDRGGGFGHSG
ncbi:MAG: aminotransferase [Clostridiales bacterium]|nr:aminotransferase [Eubacteriales bacterium]MDH7566082.1 aminotransferase [Clostridiales bacterium]